MIKFWKAKKHQALLRSVAFTIGSSFLFTTLAAPFAQATIWSDRAKASARQRKQAEPIQLASASMGGSMAEIGEIPALSPSNLGSGIAQLENSLSGQAAGQTLSQQNLNQILDKFRKSVPAKASGSQIPSWLAEKINAFGSAQGVYMAPSQKLKLSQGKMEASAPIILHVQDVHGIFSVQKNISSIIGELMGMGVNLVGVEGAEGRLEGVDYWRNYPSHEGVTEAAGMLLQQGLLTGAELAGISRLGDAEFFGLERAQEYNDQVQAFKSTLSGNSQAKFWKENAEKDLASLKTQFYSAALKDLDDQKVRFEKHQSKLGDWVEFLSRKTGTSGYPNVAKFLRAHSFEKALDFKKVGEEQKTLTRKLSNQLEKQDLVELLQTSILYRLGKIGYSEFYAELKEKCRKAGVALSPEMAKYIEYVSGVESISHQKLFDEVISLEERAWKQNAGGRLQSELCQIDSDFRLMKKGLDFTLSPAEWEKFKERQDAISGIEQRIRAFGVEGAKSATAPSSEFKAVLAALASVAQFNELSHARNGIFVNRLAKRMKSKGSNVSVLVSGGYHTAGMEKLWKERNISFITIRPNMNLAEYGDSYNPMNVFTREPLPLEKLFVQEKVTIIDALSQGRAADLHFGQKTAAANAFLAAAAPALAAALLSNQDFEKVQAEIQAYNTATLRPQVEVSFYGARTETEVHLTVNTGGLSFDVHVSGDPEVVRQISDPASAKEFLLTQNLAGSRANVVFAGKIGASDFRISNRNPLGMAMVASEQSWPQRIAGALSDFGRAAFNWGLQLAGTLTSGIGRNGDVMVLSRAGQNQNAMTANSGGSQGSVEVVSAPLDQLPQGGIKFGTSGDRRAMGDTKFDLINVGRTAQSIADYYHAHAEWQGKPVLVSYDTRGADWHFGTDNLFNSRRFAEEVVGVLAANGIESHITDGWAPTPAVALAVREKGYATAVHLTPSHNPWIDAGIKVFAQSGGAAPESITDELNATVNRITEYKRMSLAEALRSGLAKSVQFQDEYLNYLMNLAIHDVYVTGENGQEIRMSSLDAMRRYLSGNPNFGISMDANHGVSIGWLDVSVERLESLLGWDILKEQFHMTPMHLGDHQKTLVEGGEERMWNPAPDPAQFADMMTHVETMDGQRIGVGTDGDGDRGGVVDVNGRFITPNEFGAIAMYYGVKYLKMEGGVAKTVPSSNLINAIAIHFNRPVYETPVGFKNFEPYLKPNPDANVVVAVEESAHFGMGNWSSYDDAIAQSLLAFEIVAVTGKTLTELLDEIQETVGYYEYARTNVPLTDALKATVVNTVAQANSVINKGITNNPADIARIEMVRQAEREYGKKVVQVITSDGVKLVFEDNSWLLIRLSGTEPVARLYTEAAGAKRDAALAESGTKLIATGKQLLGIGNEKSQGDETDQNQIVGHAEMRFKFVQDWKRRPIQTLISLLLSRQVQPKEDRHIAMAKRLGLKILHAEVGPMSGKVEVAASGSRWKTALFLLSDPVPDLAKALAALTLLSAVHLAFGDVPLASVIAAAAALPTAAFFLYLSFVASAKDWLGSIQVLFTGKAPAFILGHTQVLSGGRNDQLTMHFMELGATDTDIAGGKGANLGELVTNGIDAPLGYVITAAAYQRFLEASGIHEQIRLILDEVDAGNAEDLARAGEEIQNIIRNQSLPAELAQEISDNFERLAEELGVDPKDLRVAVRSSATQEDKEVPEDMKLTVGKELTSGSSAGQQSTYLNVSQEDLLERVVDDYASLFNSNAISYRDTQGYLGFIIELVQANRRDAVVQSLLASEDANAQDAGAALRDYKPYPRVRMASALRNLPEGSDRDEALEAFERAYKPYIDPEELSLAVVVQQMLSSNPAFTIFSYDNRTGWTGLSFQGHQNLQNLTEGRVFRVDTNYGLGESIVQGKVNPDNFLIHIFTDKNGDMQANILEKTIGTKRMRVVYIEDLLREIKGTESQMAIGLAELMNLVQLIEAWRSDAGVIDDAQNIRSDAARQALTENLPSWNVQPEQVQAFLSEIEKLMAEESADTLDAYQVSEQLSGIGLTALDMIRLAHAAKSRLEDAKMATAETVVPKEMRDRFSATDEQILQVARLAKRATDFYKSVRDMEGGIQGPRAALVQSRAITVATEIDQPTVLELTKSVVDESVAREAEDNGQLLAEGVRGRNAAVGEIFVLDKSVPEADYNRQLRAAQNRAAALARQNKRIVLGTSYTTPQDEPAMKVAGGILADEGGDTSHAAIVSRELKIAAVVGISDYLAKLKQSAAKRVAEIMEYLRTPGNVVTIEANQGKIYRGELPIEIQKVAIDVARLPKTHFTKPGLIAANPNAVREISKIGLYDSHYGISLARAEFILLGIGIHPRAVEAYDNWMALQNNETLGLSEREQADVAKLAANPGLVRDIADKIRGYSSAKEYYIDRMRQGIASMAAATGLHQKVLYRFNDFKQNELNKITGGADFGLEEEASMVGDRGSGWLLKEENRTAMAMEIEALRRAYNQGYTNVGAFLAFVRTPEELAQGLVRFEEMDLPLETVGMMVELPSNVIQARDFGTLLAEYALRTGKKTFFSFGTNDLTQTTLMTGREEPLVRHLFREEHGSVIGSIRYVAAVAAEMRQRYGVDFTCGLCGQAIVKLLDSGDVESARKIVTELDSAGTDVLGYMKLVRLITEAELDRSIISAESFRNATEITRGRTLVSQGAASRRVTVLNRFSDLSQVYLGDFLVLAPGFNFNAETDLPAVSWDELISVLDRIQQDSFDNSLKKMASDIRASLPDTDADRRRRMTRLSFRQTVGELMILDAIDRAGAVLKVRANERGDIIVPVGETRLLNATESLAQPKPRMTFDSPNDGIQSIIERNGSVVTIDFARGTIYEGEMKFEKLPSDEAQSVRVIENPQEPGAMNAKIVRASNIYMDGDHPLSVLPFQFKNRVGQAVLAAAEDAKAKGLNTVVYQTSDLNSLDYRYLRNGENYAVREENPPLGLAGLLRFIYNRSRGVDQTDEYERLLKAEIEILLELAQELQKDGLSLSVEITDVRDLSHLEIGAKLLKALDPEGILPIGMRFDNPDNYLRASDYIRAGNLKFVSVNRRKLGSAYLAADLRNEHVYAPVDDQGRDLPVTDDILARNLVLPINMIMQAASDAGIPFMDEDAQGESAVTEPAHGSEQAQPYAPVIAAVTSLSLLVGSWIASMSAAELAFAVATLGASIGALAIVIQRYNAALPQQLAAFSGLPSLLHPIASNRAGVIGFLNPGFLLNAPGILVKFIYFREGFVFQRWGWFGVVLGYLFDPILLAVVLARELHPSTRIELPADADNLAELQRIRTLSDAQRPLAINTFVRELNRQTQVALDQPGKLASRPDFEKLMTTLGILHALGQNRAVTTEQFRKAVSLALGRNVEVALAPAVRGDLASSIRLSPFAGNSAANRSGSAAPASSLAGNSPDSGYAREMEGLFKMGFVLGSWAQASATQRKAQRTVRTSEINVPSGATRLLILPSSQAKDVLNTRTFVEIIRQVESPNLANLDGNIVIAIAGFPAATDRETRTAFLNMARGYYSARKGSTRESVGSQMESLEAALDLQSAKGVPIVTFESDHRSAIHEDAIVNSLSRRGLLGTELIVFLDDLSWFVENVRGVFNRNRIGAMIFEMVREGEARQARGLRSFEEKLRNIAIAVIQA